MTEDDVQTLLRFYTQFQPEFARRAKVEEVLQFYNKRACGAADWRDALRSEYLSQRGLDPWAAGAGRAGAGRGATAIDHAASEGQDAAGVAAESIAEAQLLASEATSLVGSYTVGSAALLIRAGRRLNSAEVGVIESGELVTVDEAAVEDGRMLVHVVGSGVVVRNERARDISGWGSLKTADGSWLLVPAGGKEPGTSGDATGKYVVQSKILLRELPALDSPDVCIVEQRAPSCSLLVSIIYRATLRLNRIHMRR